jgi:hypothetical protein
MRQEANTDTYFKRFTILAFIEAILFPFLCFLLVTPLWSVCIVVWKLSWLEPTGTRATYLYAKKRTPIDKGEHQQPEATGPPTTASISSQERLRSRSKFNGLA